MADSAVPEVPGFTVGRELGRGGSSTVWLVTEHRTGRDFALKCFAPETPGPGPAPNPTAESDVRREVRILSALDHQHLIKAHDVLRVSMGSSEVLGLLVDYAPGGSLAQLVSSRGKLTVGETVTVLTPVAQVLGYLHSSGFTHSDVSPGNVLFTSHGKPLLADVGIARMVGDPAAVPGHGTRGFMDPAGVDAVRAGLQPERDVYSVAALGWYCLTGDAPARTADRPPLPLILPEVPTELAEALEAGLHEDRRRRPSAAELAVAIYRSAAPLPVDLAGSVHPSVLPDLLTRRPVPERSGSGLRESFHALRRRISTSKWSGVVGARQGLPFPGEKGPGGRHAGPGEPRPIDATQASGKRARSKALGAHAVRLQAKATAKENDRDSPSAPRMPGRTARIAIVATMLAVLAAAWLLVAPVGQAPPAPNHGRADSTASRQSQAGVRPETTIPVDITARVGSADPEEAVQGLAALRSLAFSSGRLELLDQVNVQGSTAAAADEQIGGPLRASGHVLAGFTSFLSEVRVLPDSDDNRAVVALTSAASPYEEQDRSGALVAKGPAAPAQQLKLVLVQVEGKWRILEILPGP
ncbi:serine/threonine-protein kinase [Pseudarthrobacter sp. NPDC055928]|uniref:serine/threonine-protein kinase n=1 Tax=Pseudarthrobacter sp. NPDC055928 TaxID=3345661 RepID=UPI0035DDF8A3